LKRYLPSIKRYSWILLVCIVVSSIIGFMIGKSLPPVFQVSSTILVQTGAPGTSITTLTSSPDPTQSLAEANTYAAEIPTRDVMTFIYKQYPELAAKGFSPNDLLADITAVPSTTSATVAVTASATTPADAVLLANRVADGFVLYSQQQAQHELDIMRQGFQTQLTNYQQQQKQLEATLAKIANPNDPNYIFTNNSLTSVNHTIDQLQSQLLSLPQTVRSDVSVVQHAELGDVTSSGKTTIIVAATAAVGLILGILIMMLMIFLDDRLQGDDQVQKKLGLAYLGSVGTHKELDAAPTRVAGKALEEIGDVYAGLRLTGLISTTWRAPQGGVLLVTSAQEAEGKTTVTAALAASLASVGSSVVVIDGNLRKPGTHLAFGMGGNALGLSGLLKGAGAVDDAVQRSNIPNVWLLPAGTPNIEPTFLLEQKLPAILAQLRKKCDFIIIDGPAMLSNADGLLLASMADCAMLVVDVRHCKVQLLERARDLLVTLARIPAGVMLNRVTKRKRNTFYAAAPVATSTPASVETVTSETVSNGNGHGQKTEVAAVASLPVVRASTPPPASVPPTPAMNSLPGFAPIEPTAFPMGAVPPRYMQFQPGSQDAQTKPLPPNIPPSPGRIPASPQPGRTE